MGKEILFDFLQEYKNEEVSSKRVECYLSHNFTVVAKAKDKIVGMLQWYLKEDPKHGLVEFEGVFIFEEYRGKKVGSLLIEFAIQSVKNYCREANIKPRRIYLFVTEDNKAARGLYEKFGFKNTSRVGNLFSDEKNDLLYVLRL